MLDSKELYEKITEQCTPMNTVNLCGAIAKVQELCK
jgi:hypothetical protein